MTALASFPPAVDLVTVGGTLLNLDGSPASGWVRLSLPIRLTVGGGVLILPSSFTATLDSTGTFALSVPATDDTDLSPEPFEYELTAMLSCVPFVRAHVSLPMAVPVVDLADLLGL